MNHSSRGWSRSASDDGHPGEVLCCSGLDDQLASRERVEERGLDCGAWLDLEEVCDLGDDRAGTMIRPRNRRNRAVHASPCLSLALSIATGGLVSAISIGALRELLAQDLLGALGQIRRAIEQADEGEVPHRTAAARPRAAHAPGQGRAGPPFEGGRPGSMSPCAAPERAAVPHPQGPIGGRTGMPMAPTVRSDLHYLRGAPARSSG